jgi:hypothetical protein
MKRIVLLLAFALLLLAAAPLTSAEPQANTYYVDSYYDYPDLNPGDGICDAGAAFDNACTLVAAVQEANADGVDSVIRFTQPFVEPDDIAGCYGVDTPIVPAITANNTTIEAGWFGDRPGVALHGGDCCLLRIASDGNTILGIQFSSFEGHGICIDGGSDNIIGGHGHGERNVFIYGTGVRIGGASSDNTIIGNYFGTIDGEHTISSTVGIALELGATGTMVKHNLIGGHDEAGVLISYADRNVIQGNTIGILWEPWEPLRLPNVVGVLLESADANVIGPGNRIAGNTDEGILIDNLSDENVITTNTIGSCDDAVPNGGDGIHVHDSVGNQILDNEVGCNDGNGVTLRDGDGALLQRNEIYRNSVDGIYVYATSGAQIGGTYGEGNSIHRNVDDGVHLYGPDTYHVRVIGNDIGLEHRFFDSGNQGYGILVDNGAHDNWIGGTLPGEGNWVAYNHKDGIRLTGSYTNVVVGNTLGAEPDWGSPAPNGWHGIGVYGSSSANWIGLPFFGNIVLASNWSGIAIVNSNGNQVWSNFVGTDGADHAWGNGYFGLAISNGSGNVIIGNEFAYNGASALAAGVQVDGGVLNLISLNSIHVNTGPGISLINGGNTELAAPTVSHATCEGTLVAGSSCAGCTVEIFSDGTDEGRVYEGSTTAHASTGFYTWTGTVNGPNVTATSIDAVGNTSPFAAPLNVGVCNFHPTAVFTHTPTSGDACTFFTFDASDSWDPEHAASLLEVRWDWDNNGFYDTDWTTTKTAVHMLGKPYSHVVRLQVRDTGGLLDATTRRVLLFSNPCSLTYLPLTLRSPP